LNLGELLVEELGLGSSVDTLSRWMSHYIAQQIVEIGNAIGWKKEAAEIKCFETILKLWKHRAYYRTGNKPFENFEPIFHTLERLNPDNEEPFYFQPSYSARESINDNETDNVKQYLSMASSIDKTVRIWLKFIFQQAAEWAVDEKTKEWLKAATPLSDKEASLIVRILSNEDIDENDIADNKEEKAKLVKHRIEQLKSFREFNEELILMYEEELKVALD
jgi:hypothetical protein